MKRFAYAISVIALLSACGESPGAPQPSGEGVASDFAVDGLGPYIGVWESGNTGIHRVFSVHEDGEGVVGCLIDPDTSDRTPINLIDYRSADGRIVGASRAGQGVLTFEYTGYPVPGGGEIDWDIVSRSGSEQSLIKQTWSAPMGGAMTVASETENPDGELVLYSDTWFLLSDLEPSCD